jgi:hypothetical protein
VRAAKLRVHLCPVLQSGLRRFFLPRPLCAVTERHFDAEEKVLFINIAKNALN